MFGYDRINERFLVETATHYEIPEWKRAAAEHHENHSLMNQVIKFLRSAR